MSGRSSITEAIGRNFISRLFQQRPFDAMYEIHLIEPFYLSGRHHDQLPTTWNEIPPYKNRSLILLFRTEKSCTLFALLFFEPAQSIYFFIDSHLNGNLLYVKRATFKCFSLYTFPPTISFFFLISI